MAIAQSAQGAAMNVLASQGWRVCKLYLSPTLTSYIIAVMRRGCCEYAAVYRDGSITFGNESYIASIVSPR